ncbi:glutamate decarboxylase-like protein-like protein 1 [Trichodelitschia bisporula]|uniref:Glutamate decarboxylase-like protein-like protein 1 n=1 Tax=Trichodelitschia bisporula TaxID=703511 RepID=A0A6G1HVZ0_9PEZI|nr:glutamate decarboxylase-like protein-like protein 1 [Trichodelitschia bisporula]
MSALRPGAQSFIPPTQPNGSSTPPVNGAAQTDPPQNRAAELHGLLQEFTTLILPYVAAGDLDAALKETGSGHGLSFSVEEGYAPSELGFMWAGTALPDDYVDSASCAGRTPLLSPPAANPKTLAPALDLSFPTKPGGKHALLAAARGILTHSTNTWSPGFMDKLYGATNAVGVVSDLLLSVLNTNAHVYHVSPALTLLESATTRALAGLFGLTGPHAGGVSQPGGSAANQLSLLAARNRAFPEAKEEGLAGCGRLVVFTSAHGHYSLEKAARMFGIGARGVRAVPVDEGGRMIPAELGRLVGEARMAGETPFYVNATAGTTVLGSYDPLEEIAGVCEREGLWLHVDGSWGGPVVFSEELRRERLRGVERADSVAVTPHKMLGVPVTCSFLLVRDLRVLHAAMTLPAGYLFHDEPSDGAFSVTDLADLTPQCGRRADALKLYLGWTYYGRSGYAAQLEHAFGTAQYLFDILAAHPDVVLVSQAPLPCLQVCFYYAPGRALGTPEENSRITVQTAKGLVERGWMVDYAPGENGRFFRVVVNRDTGRGVVEGLVKAIAETGAEVVGRK